MPEPSRILQVHNTHRVEGGEDHAVERERVLLTQRGHDVSQHLVENPETALASTKAFLLAPWNPSAARGAVAAARAHAADVVHVHNTWFSLTPSVVAGLSRAGFPVVVTLHNFRVACVNGLLLRDGHPCTLCVGSLPWHGAWHRCYRDSAVLSAVAAAAVEVPRRAHTWERHVDVFLALDQNAVPLLAAGGVPEERIVVRTNSAHDPGSRDHPPSTCTDVLYAGRLSREKGSDVLVEAWRRAQPHGLTLVVCGDGPLRSELEALHAPGVTFAGRVGRAELDARMRAARALVFPSVCQEAGPLAPIEAAAAGLPTLISASVGFARRVVDAGAGWAVPAGDVDALSGALTTLCDGAAVDRAGAAARNLYEQFFGDAAAYDSLLDVYRRAVASRAGS